MDILKNFIIEKPFMINSIQFRKLDENQFKEKYPLIINLLKSYEKNVIGDKNGM